MNSSVLRFLIVSNAIAFRSKYRVFASTDSYVQFVANTSCTYSCVSVYRTSDKCFRVMFFSCYLNDNKTSEYKSFRTLSGLCYYLDTLASRLV